MIRTVTSTANDRMIELTGRGYLSHSAISTFQQCPLKYRFKYIDGLPEETVAASLVFGGAIHKAVEFHFQELLAGEQAPGIDELLAEYHDAWQGREPGEVQFGKDDDVNTLGKLAERMLIAFQASEFANPNGTIVAVEEEFQGELVPGCPDLLGRVDLLIERGDTWTITDLKTSRSRWSQEQADDSAEQLLLYSELVQQVAPKQTLKLEFAVITKTKEPVVERYDVLIDPRRIERTKRIVSKVWRAIEAGNFYPAPSPMNCPSCPFRVPCRAWQG